VCCNVGLTRHLHESEILGSCHFMSQSTNVQHFMGPKGHFGSNKSQLFSPVLSQINLVYCHQLYFLRSILISSLHLWLRLPSDSFPQISPPNPCMYLSSPHPCHMFLPSHSSCSDFCPLLCAMSSASVTAVISADCAGRRTKDDVGQMLRCLVV